MDHNITIEVGGQTGENIQGSIESFDMPSPGTAPYLALMDQIVRVVGHQMEGLFERHKNGICEVWADEPSGKVKVTLAVVMDGSGAHKSVTTSLSYSKTVKSADCATLRDPNQAELPLDDDGQDANDGDDGEDDAD